MPPALPHAMAVPATRLPDHLDAPRSNLLMRSGRWVNLYDPSPADIMLDDWVTGTSRAARWGGQTRGDVSYNVLHHSLIVEETLTTLLSPRASPTLRLAALAHDLHEGGGLGDVVTPYGRLFAAAGLRELKARVDRALFIAIGLPWPLPDAMTVLIKKADRIVAISEAVQLMGWPERQARRDIGGGYRGRLWLRPIVPLDEAASRAAWMERYRSLQAASLALTAPTA
jgi:uncharacterized protein